MTTLGEQARHLLDMARRKANGDDELSRRIDDAIARLDEPLRIAVAGQVKAGKSTLVNAMVGELIAPTDARECTRVVTWYRDGVTYRVQAVGVDGEHTPLRFYRDGGALEIDLGDHLPEQLGCIEVTWPSARLREMTLIDTPGIGSITDGMSERTERFLTGDSDRPTPADAVIHLLRHVHPADVRFLEAFHDDHMAAANPVNSIGVLSRADEVGAARLDAMDSARRIAGRWRVDRRLAALVQTVVPVAGLLAEAATTLRQVEYDALATIARADRQLVEEMLVTADRFGGSSVPVGIVDTERRALLDRLGLFGVRAALAVLRSGEVSDAPTLSTRLLSASGLPMLRDELASRFGQRRDLLKARHAIATADAAARRLADAELAAAVERVVGGAHEFAELRVLNSLRRGTLSFDDDRTERAVRLLGVHGMDVVDRVGCSSSTPDEVRARLAEQLAMWKSQAEHPLATPEAAAAARVLARTCEGLLAATMPLLA